MTENQWNKLKPGDYIRNKRNPSGILVVAKNEQDHVWADQIKAGVTHTISYLRAKEFEQYIPREGESP